MEEEYSEDEAEALVVDDSDASSDYSCEEVDSFEASKRQRTEEQLREVPVGGNSSGNTSGLPHYKRYTSHRPFNNYKGQLERTLGAKQDVPSNLFTGLVLNAAKDPEAAAKRIQRSAIKEVHKYFDASCVDVMEMGEDSIALPTNYAPVRFGGAAHT